MTVMKQRAIDMISRMPEEKLYYIVQLLEGVEGLSENRADGFETSANVRGFVPKLARVVP